MEFEKRAETVVLVIVQAAPPAAHTRADARYVAVSSAFFKAGVSRMVNEPDSKSGANVLVRLQYLRKL